MIRTPIDARRAAQYQQWFCEALSRTLRAHLEGYGFRHVFVAPKANFERDGFLVVAVADRVRVEGRLSLDEILALAPEGDGALPGEPLAAACAHHVVPRILAKADAYLNPEPTLSREALMAKGWVGPAVGPQVQLGEGITKALGSGGVEALQARFDGIEKPRVATNLNPASSTPREGE